jgi:hypothetical protein
LKARISELEEKDRVRGELVFRGDAYWLPTEGGKHDGPFCSNCWDVRRDLVRMHQGISPEFSKCPTCQEPVKVRR